MATTVVVLLLALVLAAAVTDLARHKIYNWNVYPGIIAGLILNGARTLHDEGSAWPGLQFSLEGFLACGGLMFICFLLFDVGGGDVKLMAMIGAFLGLHRGIETLLWTFVLGSVMGMAILIWQIGALRMVTKTLHHVGLVWRARSWVPLTTQERQPLKRWLFLAPSALAAIGIVVSGVFQ